MTLKLADVERIDWDKDNGLVPAVVQDSASGAVLMLGYMNRAALRATLERRRVVFWSRSKERLWEKGETSGNHLELVETRLDCDADTLLVLARPRGPTCHTGTRTCFGDERLTEAEQLAFIADLERTIATRISAAPEGSYTAQLYAKGVRRVAQKAGEPDPQLVAESADLLFHLLVLLRSREIPFQAVIEELRQRHAARS
jgi:phosphoribosyl-ATP pyrophosphohydrolase/phosphoribosyl-AMP cyclohydrolase